jgi:hypothetical protein
VKIRFGGENFTGVQRQKMFRFTICLVHPQKCSPHVQHVVHCSKVTLEGTVLRFTRQNGNPKTKFSNILKSLKKIIYMVA